MMKKKTILFLILIVSLIISIAIFKDWGNFKRGLKGEPLIEKKDPGNSADLIDS